MLDYLLCIPRSERFSKALVVYNSYFCQLKPPFEMLRTLFAMFLSKAQRSWKPSQNYIKGPKGFCMNEVVETKFTIKQTSDKWKHRIVSRAQRLCLWLQIPVKFSWEYPGLNQHPRESCYTQKASNQKHQPHKSVLLSPASQPRVRKWLFRKRNDIIEDIELTPEGMSIESFIHSFNNNGKRQHLLSPYSVKGTVLITLNVLINLPFTSIL